MPYVRGDGEDTCAVSLADEAIAGSRDAGIYESDALFPGEPVRKVDVQVMRGWKMAQVLYAPMAYNPVEKKLFQLSGSAIEITFERTSLDSSSAGTDLTSAERVRDMTVNFTEMAGEYGSYVVSADTGGLRDYHHQRHSDCLGQSGRFRGQQAGPWLQLQWLLREHGEGAPATTLLSISVPGCRTTT